MELTGIQLVLLIGAAIIIGFSKTGITGATLPAVAMIAYTFGAKQSSGIMLTMLIVGDFLAVFSYGRFGKFKDVINVLPPTIIGIVFGAVIGNYLNDVQFKFLLGIIVTICLILLIYNELSGKTVKVPNNPIYYTSVGIVSGFSSMVGNAAGPIFSVYLLTLSYDKNKFMGTTSWFFLIVNLLKLPFLIFLWKTVSFDTIKYTGFMLPFIGLGALLGVYFVKKINEKLFRMLVIIMTALAAIKLLF